VLKLFQEWREGEMKEDGGGVNSSMIYCKNFCKCHNVPPPSTTIKKNKESKKKKKKEDKTVKKVAVCGGALVGGERVNEED
jgi:hypothetical protein